MTLSVTSYRDLIAWQKAMEMVVTCYEISGDFPKSEAYGLTSQLRRAAVSVAANIAEGHSRRRTKEFLHHLDIAYGSLSELETHIEISGRLEYVTDTELRCLLALTSEVGRIVNGLFNSLGSRAEP